MRFSLQNIKNLTNLIQELAVGLTRLDFRNNFEGFEASVFIEANSVTRIRNELTFIPTRRIILRQDTGVIVSDGLIPWTLSYLYLENHDPTEDVNLKVLFLR